MGTDLGTDCEAYKKSLKTSVLRIEFFLVYNPVLRDL